jgi:hypothetical protein
MRAFLVAGLCWAFLLPVLPAMASEHEPSPAAAEPAEAPAEAPAFGAPFRIEYLFDVDGKPLPFATRGEIEDFMASAAIEERKVIRTGVNEPLKVILEKDGIRVHGIFRHQNEVRGREPVPGSASQSRYFRDSYLSEIAAYEINMMLGMNNMPPTILREFKGDAGSLQLWVEKTMTDNDRTKRKKRPPDVGAWNRQMRDMRFFDNLINNVDRNKGNILIDEAWMLWLIDHTRSFSRDRTLPRPHEATRCSRQVWGALQDLDEARVRERLGSHFQPQEIEALFARREKLIELIQEEISKKGEDAVLF